MNSWDRRKFIKQSAVIGASSVLPIPSWPLIREDDRKFKLSLNPSAIGVNLSQVQLIEVAATIGFEAITPIASELVTMSAGQIDVIAGQMSESELTWDAAGLPVEFRKDTGQFKEGLYRLHSICSGLQNAGVDRMSTWIMPMHSSLTYRKNFDRHVSRMRQILDVLADYDIRLGLEYVGPQTLMISERFGFIRTLAEVQELIVEINRPNLGVQLDSFHWFCAGETEAELLQLDKNLIITCDLNDAKAGRTRDEQLDWERELPGASGVINLKSFLNALAAIGYDGPVRAEPFNEVLNQMNDSEALQTTYKAMKQSFELL